MRRYQERLKELGSDGFIAKNFKALGRELRDEFNLKDREAISILLNKHDEMFEILEQAEEAGDD